MSDFESISLASRTGIYLGSHASTGSDTSTMASYGEDTGGNPVVVMAGGTPRSFRRSPGRAVSCFQATPQSELFQWRIL